MLSQEIILSFILAIFPLSEARYSFLYMYFNKLTNPLLIITIIVLNLVGSVLFFLFLEKLELFLIKKVKWIENFHEKYRERLVKKYEKYIEKYGDIALILFIAIPIPGSGAYSGAIVARFFEEKTEKYIKDAFIGIILSIIITFLLIKFGLLSYNSIEKLLAFLGKNG